MFLNLKNKNNGNIKQIKIGYSWTTLFLGPIPALTQKFWPWFWIILITDVILFYPTVILGSIIANGIFAIYINKKYLIYLLNKDWIPADKESLKSIKEYYSIKIDAKDNTKKTSQSITKDILQSNSVTAHQNAPVSTSFSFNNDYPIQDSISTSKTTNSENEIYKSQINSNSSKEINNYDDLNKNDNKYSKPTLVTNKSLKIHRRWKPYFNYMVIDIETTGLNPKNNDIIQISAIRYMNDKPTKTFNYYVKLKNDEITPKIYSLTRISKEDLKDGLNIDDALIKFESFYKSNMKPALIGHNIDFDINFLIAKGLNIPEITIEDTMLMSKQAQNDLKLPNNKLETLKDFYNINNKSHNALDDVKTTAIVYQKLRDAGYQSKKITTKSNKSKKAYAYYKQSENVNSSEKGRNILNNSANSVKTLNDKTFAITGNLFELSRSDAKKIIENKGGIFKNGMSSKVNYLVVGIEDKNVVGEDGKSNKLRKAEELINKGNKIKILNEKEFLNLLEE